MKWIKPILAFVFLIILLFAALFTVNRKPIASENFSVEIIFLASPKDSDCILLIQDSQVVMIDTGLESSGDHILDVLKDKGIQRIQTLILTHPDKDHIGSAAQLLNTIPIDQVILPSYPDENERLRNIQAILRSKEIPEIIPTQVWKQAFDQFTIWVYPPHLPEYDKDNNYSLATLVECGDVKMFFPGDAMEKRTKELLKESIPQTQIYKVAHHGRTNSASEALIERLQPEWAIVTSDHAEKEVKDALDAISCHILYAHDEDITLQTDGTNIVLK
jgi:beta-lactamase superfamily II metal-dependent hydrolase